MFYYRRSSSITKTLFICYKLSLGGVSREGETHQVISDGFVLYRGRIPIPMRFVKWSTFFIQPENYPSSIEKKNIFDNETNAVVRFQLKACNITRLETHRAFDF